MDDFYEAQWMLEGLVPKPYLKLWEERRDVWKCHLGFGSKRVGILGTGETATAAMTDAWRLAKKQEEDSNELL